MEDYGRFRVTRNPEDRYKFRTPTLRNVELTGPWGHGGAYDSLEDAVRHHLNAVRSLHDYEPSAATLPPLPQVIEKTAQGSQLVYQPVNPARLDDYHQRDGWVQSQPGLRQNIAAANELEPSRLSDEEVTDLLAFLKTLTDPSSRDHKDLVPKRVPSNLAVAVTSQAE
jgi:cytochrome c peroxidase